MRTSRRVAVVVVVLLLGTVGGPTAVPAQEDLVTMTVSVQTSQGEPVGDATLTASWTGGSRTRTTASNGKAFIDVPAGADVQVSVSHSDYVRNTPLVVRDASEREVTMTVYDKASVRLTVEDGSGPVSNAQVVLRKDGQAVVEKTSDGSGVVESGTVEAGEYTVVVSKSGYFTVERTIDVSGIASLTLPVERGTVTLEVNVTDEHFAPAEPVEGATVTVEGSGSVMTQPTGLGRLSVPVNTWAGIEVTKDGYGSATERVFVSEADVRVDVSIEREPGLSIDLLNERVVIGERAALTVTDEYDEPVADAAVLVDGEEVARTGANGQAVIRVESTGTHDVTVRTGSLEATTQIEGVEEGQAPAPTATADDDSEGPAIPETISELPGFGVEVAVLALALVALLARRRGGRPE